MVRALTNSPACYHRLLVVRMFCTTVVDGRRFASATLMNSPVRASRPLSVVDFGDVCLTVSTMLVAGRRFAAATVINSPVFASRPIFFSVILIFSLSKFYAVITCLMCQSRLGIFRFSSCQNYIELVSSPSQRQRQREV